MLTRSRVELVRPWLLAVGLGFTVIFVVNSYLSDDAFFSFRTADNFVRGHGLRWNVADRVQTFTSPLHTLAFTALYQLTYDPSPVPNPTRIYFTSMFLSYTVALFGVLWLAARVPPWRFAPLFLLLMSSQAFVTFSSSGLENPWIHLFVVLFYGRFFFCEQTGARDYFWLFLWASACVFTRLDTALLFLPACGYLLVRGLKAHGPGLLRNIAIAAIPLVGWLAFSLVYYGFLLPNSYYAKLGMDVDSEVLRQMGAAYLAIALREDPITLLTIVVGLVASLHQPRTRLAGLSVALYTGYVYSIGGDFIGYRFLAAPFLLSALILLALATRYELLESRRWSLAACAFVVLCAAWTPSSPLRAFREPPAAADVAYYFDASNLAHWRPGHSFPFGRFNGIQDDAHCRRLRERGPRIGVSGGGYEAYCRGPEAHIVNVASIADPLLARLWVRIDAPFLPGHIFKPIPSGYLESLESGSDHFADPELGRYFEKLQRVTRAPLFGPERWKDIGGLNFTAARRYRAGYAADRSHDREPPASLVERLGW